MTGAHGLLPASLPPEVAEQLGPFYVYALVDPKTDEIFYVGKGTRKRLLAHGVEADLATEDSPRSAKVKRIKALRSEGLEPRHDVVQYGLSEREAFLVEAALIDTLADLTNAVAGHHSGREPLTELVSRLGASPVAASAPPVLLIRLRRWRDAPESIEPDHIRSGNGYRPGMSLEELLDSTRAWWKISPEAVKRRGITHAVAVHDGVSRALMSINEWRSREDGRKAFSATAVTDGGLWDAWVGPLGKRVPFVPSAQNPISYWPPTSHPAASSSPPT